jgi:predicted Zn-dependent protease
MAQLFDELQKADGAAGGRGADWLRDHPITPQRIQLARNKISAMEHNKTFPTLTPLRYTSP